MEVFLYSIIFIIGTFFGSFFTLAVYRIPRKEDILIKHSYCPNCNHKLGFFDLFPVFSYIFLAGRCQYCKNKIRPRYLILELLSGFSFLALAIGIKISIFSWESILELVFLLIYVSILFIIAGIDKEKIFIEKKVLFFGYALNVLYIIYQYTLKGFNVYQYVMYLVLFLLSLCILNRFVKKKDYFVQNIYLCIYIIFFSGIKYIFTLILTLFVIMIYNRIFKKTKNTQIPVGFCLTISNILTIIITNVVINYIL